MRIGSLLMTQGIQMLTMNIPNQIMIDAAALEKNQKQEALHYSPSLRLLRFDQKKRFIYLKLHTLMKIFNILQDSLDSSGDMDKGILNL